MPEIDIEALFEYPECQVRMEQIKREHFNSGGKRPRTAEAKKPERRHFRLIPFHDIKVGAERTYLVHGLIPREGLTVVWGPPKCGKSFWLFDTAMHIALGVPYRGRQVTQGCVAAFASLCDPHHTLCVE